MTSQAQVITYDSKFKSSYIELNRQWIEQYFEIESMDIIQLENPEKHILDAGGEIFFVVLNGEALGTCAMVPHGTGCYELAKMAVSPKARGKGFGDLLMTSAISWARSQKADRITLLSNTILEPAIRLYQKHGFQILRLGPHPDYKRGNIEMELQLKP